ncbi:MAG: hypothetical protein HGA33_05430 [Candidatus Moranbacteria bacterium]|nr:hypothetical protein [Candidatus Moranbacteria bacterium]
MGAIEQLFTAIGKVPDAIIGIVKGREVHEPSVPFSKEESCARRQEFSGVGINDRLAEKYADLLSLFVRLR